MNSSPLRIASYPFAAGTVGITLCPGRTITAPTNGPRNLKEDLAVISSEGFSAAAVLLEDHELRAFAPSLLEGYASQQIEALRFPIIDGSIPGDLPSFVRYVDELRTRLNGGKNVLIHCRGGLGRAGLTTACLFTTRGDAPKMAIRKVREARPGALETIAQERFVETFERAWRRRERILGSALGLAVGDALGAGLEFLSADDIARRHGRVTEILGGGAFLWKPGETTDDTALMMCLARSYLEIGDFDCQTFGKKLVFWLRSNPPDVGLLTRNAIDRIAQGVNAGQAGQDAWTAAGRDAAGNGSVMRCAPVAWVRWNDPVKLEAESRLQSLVTHADPRSQDACVIINLFIAAAINEKKPTWTEIDFDERTRDILKQDQWPLPTSGYALHSMQNAVVASRRGMSFEEALVEVVNQGDDADTTAAVVGAVLGAEQGISAVPERWRSMLLERESLEAMAHGLWAMSASETPQKT